MELLLVLYPKWLEKTYPFEEKELFMLNGLSGVGIKDGGINLFHSRTKGGFASDCAARLQDLKSILPPLMSFRTFVEQFMADEINLDDIPVFNVFYKQNASAWEPKPKPKANDDEAMLYEEDDDEELVHDKVKITKGFVAIGKPSRATAKSGGGGTGGNRGGGTGGNRGGDKKKVDEEAKNEVALRKAKSEERTKFKTGFLLELLDFRRHFNQKKKARIFTAMDSDGELLDTVKVNRARMMLLYDKGELPKVIEEGFLEYRIAVEENKKLPGRPEWTNQKLQQKPAAITKQNNDPIRKRDESQMKDSYVTHSDGWKGVEEKEEVVESHSEEEDVNDEVRTITNQPNDSYTVIPSLTTVSCCISPNQRTKKNLWYQNNSQKKVELQRKPPSENGQPNFQRRRNQR